MWKEYINATSEEQVLDVLAQKGPTTRIMVGGTDLVLELGRGGRPQVETLLDVSRVPGFDTIRVDEEDRIHLGPTVTHNHVLSSPLIRAHASPLAQASWQVGSPQLRNMACIAGNLVTASPANDTISPLMALGAKLVLKSKAGERIVDLKEFYTGVRQTVLQPDEMVSDIFFPKMKEGQQGVFLKLGLRQAMIISVVDVTVLLTLADDMVEDASITLGAVAPTIIPVPRAEEYLQGKALSQETIEEAARLARDTASPIDDIRGSAAYRREMTYVLVKRGLEEIHSGEVNQRVPEDPVLLGDLSPVEPNPALTGKPMREGETPIETTINGQSYVFEHGHNETLLHLVRDQAGLVGAKVGCEEGECGACTMFVDGRAVLSCMVPAPRAHHAQIVTIEGISEGGKLHPLQESFIEEGAVQCGYCTPGFIMSGVKLLEEKPHPSRAEIVDAIAGNLCRCTGYYKIIQAIEKASQKEGA
ncbi:MAG: FAD binding domain-containing protein [Anaerolineales bacterium]